MNKKDRADKNNFFRVQASYHGHFTPENLVFNANLQEFAAKVALISGLHTGGKISSPEAYARIRNLWTELDNSRQNLLSGSAGE